MDDDTHHRTAERQLAPVLAVFQNQATLERDRAALCGSDLAVIPR